MGTFETFSYFLSEFGTIKKFRISTSSKRVQLLHVILKIV